VYYGDIALITTIFGNDGMANILRLTTPIAA